MTDPAFATHASNNICSAWRYASSARSFNSGNVQLPIGCRTIRNGYAGRPMIRAMFFAVTSNGSVHSTTALLPSCSKLMPSCKLHVEQEPQSPRPVIRKSTSPAA
jgi:hypothetical protein